MKKAAHRGILAFLAAVATLISFIFLDVPAIVDSVIRPTPSTEGPQLEEPVSPAEESPPPSKPVLEPIASPAEEPPPPSEPPLEQPVSPAEETLPASKSVGKDPVMAPTPVKRQIHLLWSFDSGDTRGLGLTKTNLKRKNRPDNEGENDYYLRISADGGIDIPDEVLPPWRLTFDLRFEPYERRYSDSFDRLVVYCSPELFKIEIFDEFFRFTDDDTGLSYRHELSMVETLQWSRWSIDVSDNGSLLVELNNSEIFRFAMHNFDDERSVHLKLVTEQDGFSLDNLYLRPTTWGYESKLSMESKD